MGARKLVTISLPPQLLRKAEEMAREENRSRSELLREALRFYVEAKDVRRIARRNRLGPMLDRVQSRTKGVAAREIRKVIRESLEAVRREKRRATA